MLGFVTLHGAICGWRPFRWKWRSRAAHPWQTWVSAFFAFHCFPPWFTTPEMAVENALDDIDNLLPPPPPLPRYVPFWNINDKRQLRLRRTSGFYSLGASSDTSNALFVSAELPHTAGGRRRSQDTRLGPPPTLKYTPRAKEFCLLQWQSAPEPTC